MEKRVALVTGSSRGIGLGIALALAQKGFAVALNAPKDDAELDEAFQEVKAIGFQVMKIPFDVSDIKAHKGALDAVEAELGQITSLVNNAGVSVLSRGDLLDVSEDSFDHCMSVNAKAMFFLSQAIAKRMIARKKDKNRYLSIINITSANAQAVALPRVEYAASKAAASMISKAFAVRLGEAGIHVFDVQPGLIATKMTKAVIAEYEKQAKTGLTVLPRVGQPEDVGKIVSTLAMGELPYVTGQVISANGGLLIPRF